MAPCRCPRASPARSPRGATFSPIGVYRGPKLIGAISELGGFTIEIVKRPHGVKGFQLLPRRWVVERTFAWFGRNRRLAKDFEATIPSAEAWLTIASVRLLSRRLARA